MSHPIFGTIKKADRGTFERVCGSINPEWITTALNATGSATVRKRRLQAEDVVWLVVGMAMFRDFAITDVVAALDLVLPDKNGDVAVAPSAVSQARTRLGPEPLQMLFQMTADKWAHEDAARRQWRGLSVYALDGTAVRVPDSRENREFFGKRNNGRDVAGYPLLRLVTLMAARSHLLAAARMDSYEHTTEISLSHELFDELPQNSVLAVDRAFFQVPVLEPLRRRGHHWLTRGRKNTSYEVTEELGDGDFLVELGVSHAARKNDPSLPKRWPMRMIDYRRRGFRGEKIFTSLLDAEKYPAAEVIALYHERWEIELGYNEVKTEMLEREEAIRSQSPDAVTQEMWGVLLAYNLVRLEMSRIADEMKVSPTRISFKTSLHYVRKLFQDIVFTAPGAVPRRLKTFRTNPHDFLLPPRRSERAYPRAVKIKMSHYARNRSGLVG